MKKFICDILLYIFIPFSLFLFFNEYEMRRIPNDYAYKNNWLDANVESLQILCLGSSEIYRGIIPDSLAFPTFNAAYVSQTPEFDKFIFDKYISRCSSLKYVVLAAGYPTFISGGLKESVEDWRIRYYTIYYDCPYYKDNIKYRFESATLTGYKAFRSATNSISHKGCNDLGWGKQVDHDPTYMSIESARQTALRHTHVDGLNNKELINKNIGYYSSIISQCKERNIDVILLIAPTMEIYRQFVNSDQLLHMYQCCKSLSTNYNNVHILDYFESDLFLEDEYNDADHLNTAGAIKWTKALNDYIVGLENEKNTHTK